MNTQQTTPTAPPPFWAIAPRGGFTAYVIEHELPRMAQSKVAQQLSSTYILGQITEKPVGRSK